MIRRVTTDKNYLHLTSRIVFKEKYIYKSRLVDKWGQRRGAGGGRGWAFHFVEMQSVFCLYLQNGLEFFN